MCVYSLFYDEMLRIVNIYYSTNRKLIKLQVFQTVYSVLCRIKYSLFRLLDTSNCNNQHCNPRYKSFHRYHFFTEDSYRTRTDTFHRKIYTENTINYETEKKKI